MKTQQLETQLVLPNEKEVDKTAPASLSHTNSNIQMLIRCKNGNPELCQQFFSPWTHKMVRISPTAEFLEMAPYLDGLLPEDTLETLTAMRQRSPSCMFFLVTFFFKL